jgi:hypothetical protein
MQVYEHTSPSRASDDWKERTIGLSPMSSTPSASGGKPQEKEKAPGTATLITLADLNPYLVVRARLTIFTDPDVRIITSCGYHAFSEARSDDGWEAYTGLSLSAFRAIHARISRDVQTQSDPCHGHLLIIYILPLIKSGHSPTSHLHSPRLPARRSQTHEPFPIPFESSYDP